MESAIEEFIGGQSTIVLFIVLAGLVFVLARAADLFVGKAVEISQSLGIPSMLIGATIVSLGTTLPEASVSVLAALNGNPGLALGNAVGSIICDTGLILGLGSLIAPLPLDRRIVNRQGWIQVGAGLLLVLFCLPYSHLNSVFARGGNLPQWAGVILVVLLVVYFYWSYRFGIAAAEAQKPEGGSKEILGVLVKDLLLMAFAVGLIFLSSKILISCAEELAHRFHVPQSVIAASLVAFGTSLPELATVLTSIRKGQGGLAVGNVIGADILNVLFVAGSAAAVTRGGLSVPTDFFSVHFPVMLLVLVVFRIGIWMGKASLSRWVGALLLGIYLAFLAVNYLL